MNRIKWILILWVILAISTLFQMVTYQYFQKYDYEILDYFVTPLASLITGILLFFVVVLPVFDQTKHLKNLKRILILSGLGILYSFLFIFILHLFPILFYESDSDYFRSIFGFFVADFHNVIKNYLFQIAILFAFEYIGKEREILTKQKDLELELNQTKLQLLKSQLQPHFLFNSLNSVVAEIDHSPKKAQNMVLNLSDLLRETLDGDFEQPISIKEELILAEKYLSIEKIRYEDQLNYEIKLSEDNENLQIPKLILQPILENAIKHGFKGHNRPILIQIKSEGNSIYVQNNGSILQKNPEFGTGLRNVQERMKIFTGMENAFEIYQDVNWVVTKLNFK
ncbi:histidine kinase [Moheibacter sp. BDHS18]|uniref:Histidine kinase n=2 Tax=Moheibacter lacus TaxID=2745851 RepID=A0A838ZJQ8_9FLAO|nr:histidine kinase [Moheibacter lacus]